MNYFKTLFAFYFDKIFDQMKLAEWTKLIDNFEGLFQQASNFRKSLSSLDPNSKEVCWVDFERNIMLQAINALRLKNGFRPITTDWIIIIENKSLGSNYSHQFAIYCAELSIDKLELK